MSTPLNGLQVTLESKDLGNFDQYINTIPVDRVMEEMLELLKASNTPSDLKDFTKAAMQGFCSNIDPRRLTESEVLHISGAAVIVARATLSELQKQQS